MKVKHGKDVVTLKKIRKGHDHEGVEYIECAYVCLNNKEIGYYAENYWCGPEEIQIYEQKDKLQKIAEAYLNTYKSGFIPSRSCVDMVGLYEGSEINGFLSDMALVQAHIEPEIKKILKKSPIAVIAKDNERAVERMWSVPSEEAMECFADKIVLLKVEASNKDFEIEV